MEKQIWGKERNTIKISLLLCRVFSSSLLISFLDKMDSKLPNGNDSRLCQIRCLLVLECNFLKKNMIFLLKHNSHIEKYIQREYTAWWIFKNQRTHATNSRVKEQHHQDPRLSFSSSPVTTVPPLKDKHYPETSSTRLIVSVFLFDIDRLIEDGVFCVWFYSTHLQCHMCGLKFIHFKYYTVFYCINCYCLATNPLWPHGLLLPRLLCPWEFPGKSTGVGCHLLLQGIFPTRDWTPVSCTGRWILYC